MTAKRTGMQTSFNNPRVAKTYSGTELFNDNKETKVAYGYFSLWYLGTNEYGESMMEFLQEKENYYRREIKRIIRNHINLDYSFIIFTYPVDDEYLLSKQSYLSVEYNIRLFKPMNFRKDLSPILEKINNDIIDFLYKQPIDFRPEATRGKKVII